MATSLGQRMAGTNVTVVEGDGAHMPFADGCFSAAVAFTMLHHVPSAALQDQLLSEACRVIQPGSVFAGTDSTVSLAFRLIHIGDTMTPVDPRHFAVRLEAAGFKDVNVEGRARAFRFRAIRPRSA